MKKLVILLILLLSMPSIGQESLDLLLKALNSNSIPYISVEELRQLQATDSIYLLDAREPEEYKVSHIASATYIGYSAYTTEPLAEKIKDKNAPIVVYCSLGIRSEKIGEKLKKEGYTNVKNLYGGIFTWKNKGYEVMDSTATTTENVHAYSRIWGKWLNSGNKVYD